MAKGIVPVFEAVDIQNPHGKGEIRLARCQTTELPHKGRTVGQVGQGIDGGQDLEPLLAIEKFEGKGDVLGNAAKESHKGPVKESLLPGDQSKDPDSVAILGK